MAAKAALRVFQISARSSSSWATRTFQAPPSSHSATTWSKRASHSCSEPSSSITSAAPASWG